MNYLISPQNRILVVWEVGVFFVVIGVTIITPLLIVFNMDGGPFADAVNNITTVIYLVDILIKFNTALLVRQEMVVRRKTIALNYLKSSFFLDVLAFLPFPWIFRNLALFPVGHIYRFLPLNKLLKLFCISKTLKRIRKINFINPVFIRLFLLVFWILIAAHLVACGWVFIQEVSGDLTDSGLPGNVKYLRAYYWTVTTLTTIGYGDITPVNPVQYVYTIFVMLMGAALYGTIIGNIANIIANIDIAKNQFRDRVETVGAFLKYQNIPTELQKRITDYYDYLWESRRGYEESKLLEDLPIPLKTQVSYFLNQDILQKVPIFHNASKELIRELLLNLKPMIFTPGDYIVTFGEIGYDMYFINRGAVDVLNEDESILYATLQSGRFFGEIALLLSMPRTASVKARVYCDLYMLEKATFDNILQRYPDFAKSVAEQAEDNRRKLGLIEDENSEKELSEDRKAPAGQPPEIPVTLNHKILKDGGIQISWDPIEQADSYEMIRRCRGESKWKLLAKRILNPQFIDLHPPADDVVYRIRSTNRYGNSKWSAGVIVGKF